MVNLQRTNFLQNHLSVVTFSIPQRYVVNRQDELVVVVAREGVPRREAVAFFADEGYSGLTLQEKRHNLSSRA